MARENIFQPRKPKAGAKPKKGTHWVGSCWPGWRNEDGRTDGPPDGTTVITMEVTHESLLEATRQACATRGLRAALIEVPYKTTWTVMGPASGRPIKGMKVIADRASKCPAFGRKIIVGFAFDTADAAMLFKLGWL